MTISLIDNHLQQIFGGISTLTENHPVHALPLLIIVYSAIDQLSWLVAKNDQHDLNDFQTWVNKYIQPEATLHCTAQQMWAARNGILHMGTAESRNTRNGVKKIGYFTGPAKIPTNNDYVLVSLDKFIKRFMIAALAFAKDLKTSEHRELAESKLQQVLLVYHAA